MDEYGGRHDSRIMPPALSLYGTAGVTDEVRWK